MGMTNGFWDKIAKPCFVLAPMAQVTDAAFRYIIAKYGKPDVMWTEFVSVDGLCSEQGRKELLSTTDPLTEQATLYENTLAHTS
jgi:tRNA-dihydrouridine synthase